MGRRKQSGQFRCNCLNYRSLFTWITIGEMNSQWTKCRNRKWNIFSRVSVGYFTSLVKSSFLCVLDTTILTMWLVGKSYMEKVSQSEDRKCCGCDETTALGAFILETRNSHAKIVTWPLHLSTKTQTAQQLDSWHNWSTGGALGVIVFAWLDFEKGIRSWRVSLNDPAGPHFADQRFL